MDLYTVRNNILKGVSLQELNLRVCFYARVSTEKDEQLHSLSNQVSFFRDYIKSISKWEFVGAYIDEGISGTSVNKREKFLKMIDHARAHRFDLILTKEISRFSRNTLDSIKYTQELLANGVGVYFLNDNINTILPDSELRLTLMSSIAQDEVRKLSERVTFGMKRSIDRGVVLGNSNIYGYVKNDGKLVVDEKEAEMIRIIFDRYANTSDGLTKTARYIYSLGYKSKTGKVIDPTVMTRIIENPKYKGYYSGHKTKVLDYRTKKKKYLDKSDWIVYRDENTVPSIVSEELWQRANDKLHARQKSFLDKVIDKKIFQNRYAYSGKIYCGEHNVTYHRSSSGKRKENPVWECQVYRKDGLNGCSNHRVFEKELDKFFRMIFEDFFKSNHVIFDYILYACAEYLKTFSNEAKVKRMEYKIQQISDKKNKLLELYLDGYLNKDDYNKKVNLLNSEESNYNEKISLFKCELNDDYVDKQISLIRKKLDNWFADDICYSDVFNELVDKLYVYNNGKKGVKLKVYFKDKKNLECYSDDFGKKFHLIDSNTTNKGSKCSS